MNQLKYLIIPTKWIFVGREDQNCSNGDSLSFEVRQTDGSDGNGCGILYLSVCVCHLGCDMCIRDEIIAPVKSQLLGVCISLFPLHMVLSHPAAQCTDETSR